MSSSSPAKNQFQSKQQRRRLQTSHEKEKSSLQKYQNQFRKSNEMTSRVVRKKYAIKAYHFSNSIYQGQMSAYHRTGKGLIIHDNGLTGIIVSGTNRLKDHNIFFAQNILISVLNKEYEVEFVYKNDQKILVLTMDKKPNGFTIKYPGYLIEIDRYLVFRLKFKNNKLVEKVALTLDETDDIIGYERFDKLMGPKHIDALKFNFFYPQNPQINMISKSKNQLHIGFVETEAQQYATKYKLSYAPQQGYNKEIHGLGFVIQKRVLDHNKQFHYSFKMLSRGFYSHGKLEYFGEIYYENGNHYFGRIKEQKMHGNGLLVNERGRKFAYGEFFEGKPLKLDENPAFRLETEEGQKIYMSLRKKLHVQDPEVWIDGDVHDLPSPSYFLKQLNECMNFKHEDQQFHNLLKKQEELFLSRKVENFQQQGDPYVKRSSTGRFLSNSLYDRNNYLTSQHLMGLSRREDQIKLRQLEIDEKRRSRSKSQKQEKQKQEKILLGNSIKTKRDQQLNQTPIQKINQFQHNKSFFNDPQTSQTIIGNFTFSGDKSQTKKSNISSSKKPSQSLIKDLDPPSQRSNSKIDINLDLQNYELIEPEKNTLNIKIHSPIEKNSLDRSLSRSLSKSSRKSDSERKSLSFSKDGSRQKVRFIEPEEKLQLRASKKPQKKSIIEILSQDINLRAQKLEKQYEMLQRSSKSKKSPYKNLPPKESLRNESKLLSPSPQRRKGINVISPTKNSQIYRNQQEPTHQWIENIMKEKDEIKCLVAANQALRLANTNKIKQQKCSQYDHYTHKKRFDYTSDIYDDETSGKYQNQIPYDARYYQRSPEKLVKYDSSNNTELKRTVRQDKINSVVGRLYPHQVGPQTTTGGYQQEKIYDSSYQQCMTLNKAGKIRGDPTIQMQTAQIKYSPPVGPRGTIFKHNIVVKS